MLTKNSLSWRAPQSDDRDLCVTGLSQVLVVSQGTARQSGCKEAEQNDGTRVGNVYYRSYSSKMTGQYVTVRDCTRWYAEAPEGAHSGNIASGAFTTKLNFTVGEGYAGAPARVPSAFDNRTRAGVYYVTGPLV